jgi:hypothetical protein
LSTRSRGISNRDAGYEALQTRQSRRPGGDLRDDASFQSVENDYVKADEVDAFPADSNGYTMTRILSRIAGGFMSDEQFEKSCGPTFVALIDVSIAEDLVPMPLFEGDYTPRLKHLPQLPPGKVAAHFDRIDRKEFVEVCGDNLCFWGNVQSSLLATGTP